MIIYTVSFHLGLAFSVAVLVLPSSDLLLSDTTVYGSGEPENLSGFLRPWAPWMVTATTPTARSTGFPDSIFAISIGKTFGSYIIGARLAWIWSLMKLSRPGMKLMSKPRVSPPRGLHT